MNIVSFVTNLSLFELVLIGLYVLFFIVQILYYFLFFNKPYKHLKRKNEYKDIEKTNKTEFPGISIIITAKNEAENLQKNLPFILEQDYPNFQVVVVNNGSTDGTEDVLKRLSNDYPNLYITFIPVDSEKVNDKKLAITIGIKAAKHDILLFTEADCKPLSNKWVNHYATEFSIGKDVVIGNCQLEVKNGLSQKYILIDNLIFSIKYSSFALRNKLYFGIGRNMAYRKHLFFDNKGFSSFLNLEYGEDNLFVNKIVTKNNTSVLLSPESMVVNKVINGLTSWRSIKAKYLITSRHLTGHQSKLLAFEVFSRYGFYLAFALLALTGILKSSVYLIVIAAILYLIRFVIQIVITNRNSKLYNAGKFYLSLPILDLWSPIMNALFLNYEKKRNRNRY